MKRLLFTILAAVVAIGVIRAENRIVICKKDFKLYVLNERD